MIAACLLLAILAAGARTQDVSQLQCVSTTPSARRVSVVSYRNQTGHWTAEVEFEHKKEAGERRRDEGLWRVDVDVKSMSCQGVELSTRVKFTLTAPLRSVDSSYEHAPGVGFYKLHSDLATWPRAREICAEEGSHLVIINSEDEAAVVGKLLKRFPNVGNKNWSWVGLRESETVKNQFFTIFGQPFNDTGYPRWGASEPSKETTTGDYVVVSRSTSLFADVPVGWGWKDLPFVCEQELW